MVNPSAMTDLTSNMGRVLVCSTGPRWETLGLDALSPPPSGLAKSTKRFP